MTIHTTTNYGIAYCDSDTALADLATASLQAATTIDTALGRGGIAPPDATTQAQLAARIAAVEGAQNNAWATYTPVLSQVGGGGAVGATTGYAGKYSRQGRLVVATFYLALGTGFAQGTGAFEVTLPVAAAAVPTAVPAGLIVGDAWLFSATTAAALCRLKANGKLEFLHHGSTGGAIAGTGAPWAWAAGSVIAGTVTYEAGAAT